MEQLFLQLARMGLYASALVLVVIALRALLKNAPKRIVCLLWALVAFRLVCPAQIEWRASLMLPPEKVVQTVQEMPNLVLPAQNAPTVAPEQPENTAPAEPTPAAPDLTMVLSRVWLAGMIMMILWAGFSDLRLRRRLRASVRMQNGVWLNDEIDTPFVLGLFSPRIYLPYGWDDEQNVYILAHERAHIARGDNWWKLFGWGLLAVYWFHPLLWLAYVLFCRDLELACDEHAVRGLDREGRAAYSQALLDCSSPRRTAFTFPVAFGEIGVQPRVKAVLYRKEPAFWLVLAAVLALIAAAVFFLTDRPAEEWESVPELVFRDVADLPPIYADHVEALTDAEIRSIMAGPDAEQMLSDKQADSFFGNARFDADDTFRGVTLEWEDYSRRGSYMVFLGQTTLVQESAPVIGDAFTQTCTVRDVPVDAQRCEWNGSVWLMADFVRQYEGENPIAVHATVGCNPREGQKEAECIHRLYEIVVSFLNPANKVSLDAVASTFAEMDEQMKFLRRASTEQLINLFPRSDGAYTELLITRLAEAAREGYEGVMAQIDESSLTAEQKAQLQTVLLQTLEDDHAYMSAVLPDAQGNLTVPLYDLQVTLPEEWKGRVIGVGTQTGPGYWLSVCNQQLIDAYEEYDFSEGQGWRDSIFWVCAVDKQTHPDSSLDFPSGGLQPVFIGESDWMRIYACVGRIPGHDSFETTRAQFIEQIGQARYEALVGDLTVDESRLRDYVRVREGAAP